MRSALSRIVSYCFERAWRHRDDGLTATNGTYVVRANSKLSQWHSLYAVAVSGTMHHKVWAVALVMGHLAHAATAPGRVGQDAFQWGPVPPDDTPSNLLPDGPLLGNGNLGVALG